MVQVPPPGQVVATQVVVSRGSPGTQPSYTVTLARVAHIKKVIVLMTYFLLSDH